MTCTGQARGSARARAALPPQRHSVGGSDEEPRTFLTRWARNG